MGARGYRGPDFRCEPINVRCLRSCGLVFRCVMCSSDEVCCNGSIHLHTVKMTRVQHLDTACSWRNHDEATSTFRVYLIATKPSPPYPSYPPTCFVTKRRLAWVQYCTHYNKTQLTTKPWWEAIWSSHCCRSRPFLKAWPLESGDSS